MIIIAKLKQNPVFGLERKRINGNEELDTWDFVTWSEWFRFGQEIFDVIRPVILITTSGEVLVPGNLWCNKQTFWLSI